MVGAYFALFWIQCVVGISIDIYNQITLLPEIALTDIILQVIVGSGQVSLGAAANSFLVAISVEEIMVLAAWVKKRQFERGFETGVAQGITQGKEQGIAEGHKRANAKIRAWAEEKGIPIEELPTIEDETEGS